MMPPPTTTTRACWGSEGDVLMRRIPVRDPAVGMSLLIAQGYSAAARRPTGHALDAPGSLNPGTHQP